MRFCTKSQKSGALAHWSALVYCRSQPSPAQAPGRMVEGVSFAPGAAHAGGLASGRPWRVLASPIGHASCVLRPGGFRHGGTLAGCVTGDKILTRISIWSKWVPWYPVCQFLRASASARCAVARTLCDCALLPPNSSQNAAHRSQGRQTIDRRLPSAPVIMTGITTEARRPRQKEHMCFRGAESACGRGARGYTSNQFV